MMRYGSYRRHSDRWFFVTLGAVTLAIGAASFWLGTRPDSGSAAGNSAVVHKPGSGSPLPSRRGAAEQPPSSSATPAVPPIGVYVGPGQQALASAVDHQLGGRVVYALDFLSTESWGRLTHPTWLIADWAGTSFRLVVGVPMLPASGATLAQGATGAYDGEFALLAQRLVAGGLANSVLMLGWQPDDPGNPWYVSDSASAVSYVRYWDDIQETMASVPGAHFVFEWDAGDSDVSPVSPAAMYPGDTAVDIVATDAFDKVTRSAPGAAHWSLVLNRRYGPAWMESFAAEHHKPMAIAMWGTVPSSDGGGGDDPTYVTQLLRWASGAGMQMCVLWDYRSWAITAGGFPAASGALRTMLGGTTTTADVVPMPPRSWDAAQTGLGRALRTLHPAPQRGAASSGKSTRWRTPGSG